MIKDSDTCRILGVCIALFLSSNAFSYEGSLEAKAEARVEYNDNIFLTPQEHDSVTGIIIIPSLSGIIKEQNWLAKLDARIQSNNYSDKNLDSNDQFFGLTGSYNAERNVFSLNFNHDLDSNLNSLSTDFGLTGQRVNRKAQRITPQYTRLLTERSSLILSYTYSDVDYLEAEDTSFTAYVSDTGSASLIYNFTERDKLTVSLFAVDYSSKNDLVTYQLFISRLGIDHKFSETLSTDFLVGVSRRNSTNLTIQSFDFFGNTIIQRQEIDFEDRGLVLDAGIRQNFETGKINARISRDNTTNSFGGLDEVDRFELNYTEKISSRCRYSLGSRVLNITSISSNSSTTDRDIFYFDSKIYYSINRDWNVNVSYGYVQRITRSDTSEDRAPHSNRIYVGLAYNFPSLSTF